MDIIDHMLLTTNAATLGILCILLGAFCYFWIIDCIISFEVLLGILFVFVTLPAAEHLICRAAYHTRMFLFGNG